eukprot:TRINITY_DN64737_c0_g1_i1.p1 TRINITY_DN64737_c0_g1~~TRINITY_DN64737_c0_g1_i1.p1  ORF type:complete len:201 (+),score=48.08 TRINITY_DN64737_c0_g1_i1:96-698(+)
MIRRPPRSTQGVSSAASDVYKRQVSTQSTWDIEDIMASAWDKYIQGFLVNKQLPGGKWLQKVVEHAAIIAHNGTILASTPGFTLGTYAFDLPIDEKSTKKISVDEKAIILSAVLKGTTSTFESGCRINNEKFMLVNYDVPKKLAYFSKKMGGACAMATKSTIILAIYNQNLEMSDGSPQNPGICNEVVEKLAETLIKSGS